MTRDDGARGAYLSLGQHEGFDEILHLLQGFPGEASQRGNVRHTHEVPRGIDRASHEEPEGEDGPEREMRMVAPTEKYNKTQCRIVE